MTCPSPEALSRWSDGTLGSREAAAVGRHIADCADCRRKAGAFRAAGAWVRTVAGPGPGCLDPEEVARILEGGPVPPHALACPRCAAELADLRPARRRFRLACIHAPTTRLGWVAAAAAAVLLAALVVVVSRPRGAGPAEVVRSPGPKAPEPAPVAAPGPEAPPVIPAPPPPVPPSPPVPEPRPAPDRPVAPPPAEPPKAEPVPPPVPPRPAPETPTVSEPPAKKDAVFSLKDGGLLASVGGKWQKVSRIEEGTPLRAEGRTRLEFASAQVTMDGAAIFSLEGAELTLLEGNFSAQVPPRSGFVLRLGACRIVPQASSARVLISAAGNRVAVDEGWARFGEGLLVEGVEHESKDGRLVPQKRRTVPAALRPREIPVWRLDLANRNATRGKLPRGAVTPTPAGPVLASTPVEDDYSSGGIQYSWGGETDIFVLKPTTAFRFRYFLRQPAPVSVVLRNRTKDESFGAPVEGVAGAWTTVTLRVMDIPVKTGGRAVTAEAGDRYGWFGWHVGRPGVPAEVLVDRIEVLEIEP